MLAICERFGFSIDEVQKMDAWTYKLHADYVYNTPNSDMGYSRAYMDAKAEGRDGDVLMPDFARNDPDKTVTYGLGNRQRA